MYINLHNRGSILPCVGLLDYTKNTERIGHILLIFLGNNAENLMKISRVFMLLVSISENIFNVGKWGCWAIAEVRALLSVALVLLHIFLFGGMHFF